MPPTRGSVAPLPVVVLPDPHARLALVDDDHGIATPAETCAEMCADLRREIESVRHQQLATAWAIESSTLFDRDGPYWHYDLVVDRRLPPLRAEEPVLLVQQGTETQIPAQVISAKQYAARVAVLSDQGAALPAGTRLVIDSTWLLERLHDRLAQIRARLAAGTPDPRFDAEMAQLAFGQGTYPDVAPEAEPHPAVLANPALTFNEAQEHALRVAAASPITYVWGPPGTGKTRTVAAIAEQHLRTGRRVIIATPSNAAADVAAEALAVRLVGDPLFAAGRILRIGPRPSAALRRTYGPYLVPQDVAARLTEQEYGPRRRALAERIAQVEVEWQAAQAGQRSLARSAGAIRRELDGCRIELGHLLDAEEAHRHRVYEQLLDECGILVTPVANLYLSQQVRGAFDVVILDEASMISLPQVYVAAGLATGSGDGTRHVVVCGDFLQLPPVVTHRNADEVPWLASDIFCRVGIPDDIARGDDPPYLVMLDEQHRMAPPISQFVSDTFYGGRLRTAHELHRRSCPPWALSNASLIYVDTGRLSPRAVVPRGAVTRENAVHARVVADLVASLTDEANGSRAGKLLILSPYTGQVERLYHGILPVTRAASVCGTSVASVHRAQGSEADTVVFTIDDADGASPSRFIRARDWTAPGARLINVAVSRARSRVVIVLDVDYLKRCGGPMIRAFVHALEETGARLDIDEIVGAWETRFGALLRW